MKPLSRLFFPQMALAAAKPERHVPQVLIGDTKRVISEAEWKAYEELERRPRKPGTNEYLTEGIVKSVDKTEK